jgi:hypothetical protein
LQYPPGPPMDGKLKDDGMAALLKALATANHGLCVITSRYSILDLKLFWQTTAPEVRLQRLSSEAGVHLLKALGVKGTNKEFEQLVSDVSGHALTLNLLGTYLRDAHAGDIRKRDLVKLEEADAEEQSGHAFHVMDAYVESFKHGGDAGKRALAILRLLGLFDRPATADCLNPLWIGEEIGGLTGYLIGLSEAQRNITLQRLQDANLITVNREAGSGRLISLDAHPLVREYFAARVRSQFPGAWRAAHRRLYEHLRDNTHEGDEPTLEDLQPLYQAVAHGCQAAMHEEAYATVFFWRIQKGNDAYAVKKLGAFGSDLGAVACFFDEPWKRPASALSEERQAFLLNRAFFRLRALGRLTEAGEPLRAALEMAAKQEQWQSAAARASNLSEMELTLGDVAGALGHAEQSVIYADRSGEANGRSIARVKVADVQHQADRRAESLEGFREAEQMQKEHQPNHPLLYSLRGFQYCDLLVAAPERGAWKNILQCGGNDSALDSAMDANATPKALSPLRSASAVQICRDVSQRAAQTLKIAERNNWLLDIAHDHLTLGRAALYAAILEGSDLRLLTSGLSHIDFAVNGLRRAGTQDMLPRGLITRAWLRFLTGARTGPESAQEDLDEAWEISERGPMRLHMVDIHLYRARLFGSPKSNVQSPKYPWNKFEDGREGRGPKDDLADARKLIEKCGYWRRKEELDDAEEVAKNWT